MIIIALLKTEYHLYYRESRSFLGAPVGEHRYREGPREPKEATRLHAERRRLHRYPDLSSVGEDMARCLELWPTHLCDFFDVMITGSSKDNRFSRSLQKSSSDFLQAEPNRSSKSANTSEITFRQTDG